VPLKKKPGTLLNPSVAQPHSQQATVANAAKQWHISPETLWGVYGTESSFGANPSTSSAGAQGPFQFIPSTWAKYGGGGNVQDFLQAAPAAAHLLHDLGATTNPNDPKTWAALNAYNGNGQGTAKSSYVTSVLNFGSQFAGAGSVSGNTGSSQQAQQAGTGSGSGSSLSGFSLWDLVTGNLDDLAEALGLIALSIVKDVWVGIWDFVVAPTWHWNQRVVAYYWEDVLAFKAKGNTYPFGWPATAVFWGAGYVLLFTDPDGNLKPVEVGKTHVAKHVRRLQAAPARRELIKPKHVQEKTPKKPKETVSRATVTHTGTLRTMRPRPVKVETVDTTTTRSYPNDHREPDRGRRSETPVERVGTAQVPHGKETGNPPPTKPNPQHNGGGNPHQASRPAAKSRPAQSASVRYNNRRR
jgi:hypothetical protein